MVRKKMKRAPEVGSSTNNAVRDLTGTVRSWLEALDLAKHDLIPAVAPDLDMFSLLQSPGSKKADKMAETETTAFAQARGLQALRADVVGGKASAKDLRLMFLVSLLLFIDPDTSHLRKAVKSLLAATESAIKEQQRGSSDSSSTDGVVELVAARFAACWWDMYSGRATQQNEKAAPAAEQPTAEQALRMAASL